MPLLNANNLPISAVERAVEVVRAQLEAAQGVSGKLNVSVKLGMDAMLKDAMEQTMLETSVPCIRITWGNSSHKWPTNSGGAIFTALPLHLFFIYSVGKRGGLALPSEFSALRERHIFWNLEHLKKQRVLPNNTIGLTEAQFKDSNGKQFWQWGEDDMNVEVTHDTPFDVFGLSINVDPSSGFACSRADLMIRVNNHCSFT